MAIQMTQSEREALRTLREAILSGDGSAADGAGEALIELARATGATGAWEAWAFLTEDTNAAVNSAVRREREAIARHLEALYADPHATWDDIIAVARGETPAGETLKAG